MVSKTDPIFAVFAPDSSSITACLPALLQGVKCWPNHENPLEQDFPLRIKKPFLACALALSLAFAPGAHAQEGESGDGKSDAEAPAGAKLGPRAGQAQQPGQAPAGGPKVKTETVGTFGAWIVQCSEIEAGADQEMPQGGKQCGMVQAAKNDKNEKLQISVIVNHLKGKDRAATFMRIIAPIGVYLPTGIPVEIDGEALKNRMQFTRCMPRVCEAFGETSPDTLARFKKGSNAIIYIYDRPGNGFPMKLSLEGFGKALAELEKL
jgi:invasion protein IalB